MFFFLGFFGLFYCIFLHRNYYVWKRNFFSFWTQGNIGIPFKLCLLAPFIHFYILSHPMKISSSLVLETKIDAWFSIRIFLELKQVYWKKYIYHTNIYQLEYIPQTPSAKKKNITDNHRQFHFKYISKLGSWCKYLFVVGVLILRCKFFYYFQNVLW